MRRELPGDPLVLFFNGAFGNINQIKNPGNWISTFKEAQRLGDTIAEYLLAAFPDRIKLEASGIRTVRGIISIQRRSAVRTGSFDRKKTAQLDLDPKQPVTGTPHLTPEKEAILRKEIIELSDSDQESVELQVVRIGDVEIVAIPGEFFVEWGLEIKSRSKRRYPLIFGNSNGYIGYVPLESSFNEGGYETRHSLTSRLVPEAGKNIVLSINQMRSSL
jgi:hypothetical protein